MSQSIHQDSEEGHSIGKNALLIFLGFLLIVCAVSFASAEKASYTETAKAVLKDEHSTTVAKVQLNNEIKEIGEKIWLQDCGILSCSLYVTYKPYETETFDSSKFLAQHTGEGINNGEVLVWQEKTKTVEQPIYSVREVELEYEECTNSTIEAISTGNGGVITKKNSGKNNTVCTTETKLVNETYISGYEEVEVDASGYYPYDGGELLEWEEYELRYDFSRDDPMQSGDLIPVVAGVSMKEWAWWNSTNSSMDYWVDDTNTSLWGKTNITNGTIGMYWYGNCTKASESNGSLVFPFFDDFNDASLDTTKWDDVSVSPGTVTMVNGSYAFLNGGGTSKPGNLRSDNTFDTSNIMVIRSTRQSTAGVAMIGYRDASQDNGIYLASRNSFANGGKAFVVEGGSSSNDDTVSYLIGAWKLTEIVHNATNQALFYDNGSLVKDYSTANVPDGVEINAYLFASDDVDLYVDYVFQRKWNGGVEPTIAYGTIETGSFDDGQGNTCGYRVEINITATEDIDDYQVELNYTELGSNANGTLTYYYETEGGSCISSLSLLSPADELSSTANSQELIANLTHTCTNVTLRYYLDGVNVANHTVTANGTSSTTQAIDLGAHEWYVFAYADGDTEINSTTSTNSFYRVESPCIANGYFAYDYQAIPATSAIDSSVNTYGYTLLGLQMAWSNLDSDWDSVKEDINHTYSEHNIPTFLTLYFDDTDYSTYATECSEINANLTDLISYPYFDGVAFIVVKIDEGATGNKTEFVNQVSKCIMNATNNRFAVYSLYRNSNLDSSYVQNDSFVRITDTSSMADLVNAEKGYLRNSTSLIRIYHGSSSSFQAWASYYYQNIIGNLRSNPKGVPYAASSVVAEMENGDLVVFNANSAESNMSIDLTSKSPNDAWDPIQNRLYADLSGSSDTLINVKGYNATSLFIDNFSKIIQISDALATLRKETENTLFEQNFWYGGSSSSSYRCFGAYNVVGEAWDGSFVTDNLYMINYEILDYAYVVNYSSYDVIIIAGGSNTPAMVNATVGIDNLNKTFGYMSVADYDNSSESNCSLPNAWEASKEAEILTWYQNFSVNGFIDGFDIAMDASPGACFEDRIKRVIDYAHNLGMKVATNTYTAYTTVAHYSDYTMRESWCSRWSGDVDDPSYAWENITLMEETATYLTSIGKPVLAQSFGESTDYERKEYCYFSYAVMIGTDNGYYRYGQPNFQTQQEIYVRDLGEQQQNKFIKINDTRWCRQYSNGQVCFDPTRTDPFPNGEYYYIDNGETINSIDFTGFFQVTGYDNCNSNHNQYITLNWNTSAKQEIDECTEVGTSMWDGSYVTKSFSTDVYEYHGHYWIWGYPVDRANVYGMNYWQKSDTTTGVHSGYNNSATPGPPATWNWYARSGTPNDLETTNWMFNLTINRSYSASVDTDIDTITTTYSENNDPDQAGYNISISSAYSYDIPILAYGQFIPDTHFSFLSYNGTVLNYTVNNSDCLGDNPTMSEITILGEVHKACIYGNATGYYVRIETPSLSEREYEYGVETQAWFVSPTPASGSGITTDPILNMTMNSNLTFESCLMEINGVNYTGTVSPDSLTCSYSWEANKTFGEEYSVTGWANNSGIWTSTNETINFTWNGCGNVESSITLTSNLEEDTNLVCLNVNASGININCAGYTITGANLNNSYGILANATHNISIYNCNIDSFYAGIYINNSENATLSNNVVTDSEYGFYIYGNYTNITAAIAYNNSIGYEFGEDYGELSNSTAYANNISGVHLRGTNNIVFNSTIYNNTIGIRISGASNTVTNNTIGNNSDYQLKITRNGQLIYNNNITRNETQGMVYSIGYTNNDYNITKTAGTNIFGGSYLGGNYWSDYTGWDTDGDGLGNIPYEVAASSYDYLPLTNRTNYAPTVVYITSFNGTANESIFYSDQNFSVDFYVVDPDNSTLECELLFNGAGYGINPSTVNNTNTTITTNASITNGAYSAVVQCFDGASYKNSSTWAIYIDTANPSVSISYPVSGQTYTGTTQNLEYTAEDATLDSCWYSIDGGENSTITNCQNTTFTTTVGTHTVTVYANDSIGNEGHDSVSFTIKKTTTSSSGTSGSDTSSAYYGAEATVRTCELIFPSTVSSDTFIIENVGNETCTIMLNSSELNLTETTFTLEPLASKEIGIENSEESGEIQVSVYNEYYEEWNEAGTINFGISSFIGLAVMLVGLAAAGFMVLMLIKVIIRRSRK